MGVFGLTFCLGVGMLLVIMSVESQIDEKLKGGLPVTVFRYSTDDVFPPDIWVANSWYFVGEQEDDKIAASIKDFVTYFANEEQHKKEKEAPAFFRSANSRYLGLAKRYKEKEVSRVTIPLKIDCRGGEKDIEITKEEMVIEGV